MRKILGSLFIFVALLTLPMSCATDATVASQNLARAAEQFEIYRRVVFINTITGEYMLLVEGYCSIEDQHHQLEVVIKTKDGSFLKHHLGLSENVSYVSEQLHSSNVSSDQYRVVFKPLSILPTIDVDSPDSTPLELVK